MNISGLPAISAGKDAEFREWFARSDCEYTKKIGFIRSTPMFCKVIVG